MSKRPRLAIEGIAHLPVGAIVATPDGMVAFRRAGSSKTDWERLRPTTEGWASCRPPERSTRFFPLILRYLRDEGLIVVDGVA